MSELGDSSATTASRSPLIEVTSRLVSNLRRVEGWELCIEEFLSELGSTIGASRSYCLEFRKLDEQTAALHPHGEWNAPGVAPHSTSFHGLAIPGSELLNSEWIQRAASGSTPAELVDCPEQLLTFLERGGVRSLVMAPVQVNRECWGILSVEDCGAAREWTSDETGALHLLADALGSAVERQSLEGRRVREWAIVESSEDAIISKRLDGIVTEWNQSAERIYGYSRHEMIGEPITRIIPAELHEDFQDIMRRLRAGERIEHHETYRLRKDGSRVAVSLSISPVNNYQGEIAGAVSIARDITDRMQAEISLRASEERLRMALEAGRIGAWDWHIESGRVVWSPNMERLHGLEPGAFDGTFENYQRSIHPEDFDRVVAALNQSLAGDAPYQTEYRSLQADRSYQWLSAQGTVVRDTANRPVRMTGVCYDITERKRVEAARTELLAQIQHARAEADAENARLREMFQHAPAMMALLEGPEHVFVHANDHFLGTVGYRDVLGKPVAEAIPELVDQGLIELLDQVFHRGETITRSELPVLIDHTGDGALSELYFSFAYQPVRGMSGTVSGVLVHAVDLTDHVRDRQRVEELVSEVAGERDRLQQIIDVMPEGVAICDASGEIYLSNAAALDIWGEAPSGGGFQGYEILQPLKTDQTPYPWEDLPLTRSVTHGETVLSEQMVIRNVNTAELVDVLVNSAPLRDDAGNVLGGVAVFQDIRSLKEFERQKDEFLQAITHDLRNPLATILGNAQLLQRITDPDPERLESAVTNMESATNRAIALVDEILDLTRLQMGRTLDLASGRTNLVELVRRIAGQHQSMTEDHQIVVKAECDELTGECDEVRFERVIANLVSNAILYSPDGGIVEIRIRPDDTGADPCALISIRDEGVGIPRHEMPLLFQRFWRGSRVRGTIRGTGLGLAGARAIVEAHGGEIDVESVEGEGSTFTVRLPLKRSGSAD